MSIIHFFELIKFLLEIINMPEQQITQWYKAYFSILFNYGMQISNNRELVKDCIQDVFVTLKSNPNLIKSINAPKAYLLTILRRNIIKQLKISTRSLDQYFFREGFVAEPSFEDNLIDEQTNKIFKHQLIRSINKLTTRQREAVFLKFYEGLSYQELADTMQLQNIKSARNLVYRAVKQLKADFEINGVTISLSLLLTLLLSL